MTEFKAFIARHAVPAYFVLTFAISWGAVLVVIGSSGEATGAAPTNDPRFAYAVIAMLLGPSISGILLTVLVDGRAGLHALLSRACNWRVQARWHAVALLAAPVLWVSTLVVLSVISPMFLPGLWTSTDKMARVTIGLTVAIGAGILEEVGWTGFAIPRIRRRRGVFATGLLVGALWGAWHLLVTVFWAGPMSAGDMPRSIYQALSIVGVLVGYLTAFRILMVWVYDATESLLVAMLMHVSLTACVLILDPVGISGMALLTYSFALAATVWIAVAAIVGVTFRWTPGDSGSTVRGQSRPAWVQWRPEEARDRERPTPRRPRAFRGAAPSPDPARSPGPRKP
jgi:membrane protease YdiL (CAAX protease family)